MLIAIAMEPSTLQYNYLPILAVMIPAIAFIFIIVKKPHALLVDNYFFKQQEKFYSIDHKYNSEKLVRQKEIDAILEKIHKKGMKSLTREERETLAAYSETIR